MLLLEIMNVFYIYIYIFSKIMDLFQWHAVFFLFFDLSQTSLVTLFKNVPFVDRPKFVNMN